MVATSESHLAGDGPADWNSMWVAPTISVTETMSGWHSFSVQLLEVGTNPFADEPGYYDADGPTECDAG